VEMSYESIDTVDAERGDNSDYDNYNNNISFRNSIKSVVLGGCDGVYASMILIGAAAGCDLSWEYVLIMGVSGT